VLFPRLHFYAVENKYEIVELHFIICLICVVGGGVQLVPLGTAATNRPIVPEIGEMIGRGNRSTRRKPAPVPLCPPQTPHASQPRTRAAAVRIQRLTARATARPWSYITTLLYYYYYYYYYYYCPHRQ
jgi:hypothetical protein